MPRLVEWSPDAAHRRACAPSTNMMPSAVCAADAALTELADAALLVRPNVRAKPDPTVGRAGPVGENVQRTADRARVARRWGSA